MDPLSDKAPLIVADTTHYLVENRGYDEGTFASPSVARRKTKEIVICDDKQVQGPKSQEPSGSSGAACEWNGKHLANVSNS